MSDNVKVTTIEDGVKTTREYTPEQIQDQTKRLTEKFFRQCHSAAKTWAEYPDKTPLERTTGVLHSLFAILDGSSPGIPSMDLVPVGAEEEPPTMYDITMVGSQVDFTDEEALTPLTTIESGSLAFRFVNFNKEVTEKVAE